jgi:hypothetical protein
MNTNDAPVQMSTFDEEQDIDIVITDGPDFTQWPDAMAYSYPVTSGSDLVHFGQYLGDQLKAVNRAATEGLEVSDIIVSTSTGERIASNKAFKNLMKSRPPVIHVSLAQFKISKSFRGALRLSHRV